MNDPVHGPEPRITERPHRDEASIHPCWTPPSSPSTVSALLGGQPAVFGAFPADLGAFRRAYRRARSPPRGSGGAAAGFRVAGLTWSSGRLVMSLTGFSRLEPVQAVDGFSSAAMVPGLGPAAAAQRRRRRLRDPRTVRPSVCPDDAFPLLPPLLPVPPPPHPHLPFILSTFSCLLPPSLPVSTSSIHPSPPGLCPSGSGTQKNWTDSIN